MSAETVFSGVTSTLRTVPLRSSGNREPTSTFLERYRRVVEPPTAEIFVFPTEHAPSKYAAVRDHLENADEQLAANDVNKLIRDHRVVVPSISTAGARNLMQRLCEDAGLEINGEYLKTHGGRRGLGHELYSKEHAELAQTALRHSSIETTHQAYSDIQAKETAKRVNDILDR